MNRCSTSAFKLLFAESTSQHNSQEPTTVDEPRRLEEILILLLQALGILLERSLVGSHLGVVLREVGLVQDLRLARRLGGEATALVDSQKLLGDEVVVACGRRERQGEVSMTRGGEIGAGKDVRVKTTAKVVTAAGMRKRRLAETTSGCIKPALPVRTLSCSVWLLPCSQT